MSKFGDEVKRLRKDLGLTQARLAKDVGITQPTVSQIESGELAAVSSDTLFRLCSALKVPLDHFAKWVSPGTTVPPPPPGGYFERMAGGDGFGSIPLKGVVPGGKPIHIFEQQADRLDFQAEFCVEGAYALQVRGDSMRGDGIFDGDRVVVVPADAAEHDDLVVAEVDGEMTLKWLRLRGKEVWLHPANEMVEPIRVDPKKSFRVVGRVIGVVRRTDEPKKKRRKK